MDPIGRYIQSMATPLKYSQAPRFKNHTENSKCSENSNPNLSSSTPNSGKSKSPAIKSAKSQKPSSKNSNTSTYVSPRNRIRERRFIVAKKKGRKQETIGDLKVACKCQEKGSDGNSKKCLCVAYENLRASQEEFIKNQSGSREETRERKQENGEMEKGQMMPQTGSSTYKRRRDRLMEEARKSVPESGAGKVMHLVKAFERIMSIPKETAADSNDNKESEEGENVKVEKRPVKWPIPGLQPPKVPQDHSSVSSFSPSELMLSAENLGLDSIASLSSSWNGSGGSTSSRNSEGGRRSRRNSSESCVTALGGKRWKKKQQLKITCQKPFNLRTEERGRLKEEEFMKKMQEMMEEEERLRIPIAQGLPWTTDQPECLVKPPVKENTRPLDIKLHSDLRANERTEFDQQVAEKMSLVEQYKMERERLQKMEEEEDIRRLRKELIPRAQPMPYFDRPFIPRRSSKNPTIPREPKFHIPQNKKIMCGLSCNDISPYIYHQ
ncbi:hypothetical protein SAY86_015340 [Trapa natans]|uniref:TPX2 C-terminal domain-containing protein n=1 Tax=Trapa natans TaxID=22666 RepID=A0AAN7KQ73_TRANT|nr:hypothetical protein SAY86_015340 [Trapa natans]